MQSSSMLLLRNRVLYVCYVFARVCCACVKDTAGVLRREWVEPRVTPSLLEAPRPESGMQSGEVAVVDYIRTYLQWHCRVVAIPLTLTRTRITNTRTHTSVISHTPALPL